ncbi:uncharacterized protein LOC132204665 [Neocloeon triangulifer]|uniref:uncharacterized protein LOC132204665 n=1 Tax=Neocloeon triangulifer TaxID=2078957 RepID=UPI00286ECDD7|nr:uncharacterized protein LOC132204665 [Neocloeon triangulifer]
MRTLLIICLGLAFSQALAGPVEVTTQVDVVPDVVKPVVTDEKVITPVIVAEKVIPVAIPVPAEKIPIVPVDEHHTAQIPIFVKAEKVPVGVTPVEEPKYVVVEAKALAFESSLKRLQFFERTYMANPFPVDEHFRLVFDSMVDLGVERTQLDKLKEKVFGNLEAAQKATYEHSYMFNTLIELVEEVVYKLRNGATKDSFVRSKIAVEEVAKLLRADLSEIRVRIHHNLETYTGTIRALTDVYTNPDAAVVKRHMKLVKFIYDLGHDELEDILSMLTDDWNEFLADYEKFINAIADAVDDFITDDTTGTP